MNVEYWLRSFGGALFQAIPLWVALALSRGDLAVDIGIPAAIVLGAGLTYLARWASLKVSGHSRSCSTCGHTYRVCDCYEFPEQY